jgi:uncharacterized membrane protein
MTSLDRRPDGFRERGDKVTRLETFVDAAFAFAVTLLVITAGAMPESVAELVEALERVPAFAAAFAFMALFWAAHDNWSRRYGLEDRATTLLSLLLVFLVLIYVYPLRMLFESFFAWISLGRLDMSFRIGSFEDLMAMFVVYAVCFATLSAVLLALYLHAWRRRKAIGLDAHERATTMAYIGVYAYFVMMALGSFGVALWMQPGAEWSYGLPGMVYFLMILAVPIGRFAYRRALGWREPTP